MEKIIQESSLNPNNAVFEPEPEKLNILSDRKENQIDFNDIVYVSTEDIDENNIIDEYIDDNLVETDQVVDELLHETRQALEVYLMRLNPECVLLLPIALQGIPLKAMVDTGDAM